MRTFWEDLSKKFGETAETVTNKAGEVMEIQKLKNQIRTLERGNEDDYADLGRMVYERFCKGETVDGESAVLCEAIQCREQDIEAYEKQIADVKGDFECECCGKRVAKGMFYCPYCGEKTPDDFREKAAEYTDDLKDRAADAAEKVADKAADTAEKVADKAADAAEKVADKAADVAEKVADKAMDAAEKVVETAEKVADKLKEKEEE